MQPSVISLETMWSHCLSLCWNLSEHCLYAKHCSQKASTCLPPSSVAWLICHDMEKRPWQGSPSLAFPPLAISMRVCAGPHLTSQSSSRCSCPSIHSSISSLLCRSFLLYFTVSLPSFRCAGSSVFSTVWNITLDWVPGSDAIAATASGVFSPAHTRAERKPRRLGLVCFAVPCSVSRLPVCCCSHVCLLLSSVRAAPLSNAASGSLPASLPRYLSPLLLLLQHPLLLHYQENGNEICLCVQVCVQFYLFACVCACCSMRVCFLLSYIIAVGEHRSIVPIKQSKQDRNAGSANMSNWN